MSNKKTRIMGVRMGMEETRKTMEDTTRVRSKKNRRTDHSKSKTSQPIN
jgi:hypothetical protein